MIFLRALFSFFNTEMRDNWVFLFLCAHYSDISLTAEFLIFMKNISKKQIAIVSKYLKSIW